MTAAVVRFPLRGSRAIWLLREGPAWLVLAGSSGWLHGDYGAAIEDARWLSRNSGLPIRRELGA